MKYIASCSFGKDSIATVILAHLHNEPLDLIVFSEVMFDKNISGEHPLHIDFIYNKAIPIFESWGYEVKVLTSNKTYLDCFFYVCGERAKPERIGKYRGFPIAFKCKINSDCKIGPIKKFFKGLDCIQYVGIAADEPERLKRLENTNKISLLAKYNYTEQKAFDLCQEYDLISPVYQLSNRQGCWFCPNARESECVWLKENKPHYWERLRELSQTPNLVTYKFNRTETFEELDKRLEEKIKNNKAQLKLF
jgi:3'-phosphoadenosine 5'-phosphosulfate sulfotransferase (PAPS reductase)/FAD synthetase